MIPIRVTETFGENAIRETLGRIGKPSEKKKTIVVSVYLYQGECGYYLAHFKELLAMKNGTDCVLDEDDTKRLESIAYLLSKWKMVSTEHPIGYHPNIRLVVGKKNDPMWKVSHKIAF